LTKYSQPFGKKFQKTVGGGGIFLDSQCSQVLQLNNKSSS